MLIAQESECSVRKFSVYGVSAAIFQVSGVCLLAQEKVSILLIVTLS